MTMAQTMSDILNPSAAATRDPDFPNAPADWSRATAESVAKSDGIALGPDHWEVIKALQGWFAERPRTNVRELHDALDERFHAAGGIKYLYALLPGGPVAQGCRLAGIEPPAGAADRSFGSVQ
jgi:TusE/DsrC/DsvC family sulfur relay protein